MNFREPKNITPIQFQREEPLPLVAKEELLNKRQTLLTRRAELVKLVQPLSQVTGEVKKLSVLEIDLIDQDLLVIGEALATLQKNNDPVEFRRTSLSDAQVEKPWEATARIRGGEDGTERKAISPSDLYEHASGLEVKEIDIDSFRDTGSDTIAFQDTDLETANIVLIDPKPIV